MRGTLGRMSRLILGVSCVFALAAVGAYIVSIVNMNSDTGEVYSDVGNGVMLAACFLSLLALHLRRPSER